MIKKKSQVLKSTKTDSKQKHKNKSGWPRDGFHDASVLKFYNIFCLQSSKSETNKKKCYEWRYF